MRIYRLPENLRYLREECGYTQGALAQKINCDRHSISLWEGGCYPSLTYAMELAEFFEVGLEEFVYGDLTREKI